jgi:hypothetical protein
MSRVILAAVFLHCVMISTSRAQDYADPSAEAVEQALPEGYQVAQPGTVAPNEVPPLPPLVPPSPPVGGPAPAPATDAFAGGQWVYTAEYGWVYMPYGDQYVCQGAVDEFASYAYVYLPGGTWGWRTAPWVSGLGAYPYFGAAGPLQFGWYVVLVQNGSDWTRNRAPARGRSPQPVAQAPARVNGGAAAPRPNLPRQRPVGATAGYRAAVAAPRAQAAPRPMGRDRR